MTQGRPRSSENIARYCIAIPNEIYKPLKSLSIYDETSINELVNEAITKYLPTRQKDLDFMQAINELKQEHKEQEFLERKSKSD